MKYLQMKYVLHAAFVMAIARGVAFAAGAPSCSIHPPTQATSAQLVALAKVSQSAATQVALDAVKLRGTKKIKSAELEAEHGCLIWSFDIGVTGSKVTHEVAIDAGNAAVLSATTETTAQEADELRSESKPPHGG